VRAGLGCLHGEHREFVTAQPTDDIRLSERLLEDGSDRGEGAITREMASRKRSGRRRSREAPRTSSAGWPKMASAAGFQKVARARASAEMIASTAHCATARNFPSLSRKARSAWR